MKKRTYALLTSMFMLVVLVSTNSCKKNENPPEPERPQPTITFDGDSTVMRLWGDEANIKATLDAQAGLKNLKVTKDGADFDNVDYPDGKVGDNYIVDEVIAETYLIGTEIAYVFTITDKLDRTATATFKITVGQPPAPEIAFTGSNSALIQAGDSVDISLSLDASAKAKDLIISTDGAVFETISFTNNETELTYVYKAPTDPALLVGETVVYSFELTDQLDRKTDPISYTIEIGTPAPTFEVKDTTINAVNYKLVRGDINIDTLFSTSNLFLLSGIVKVMPATTLTIEAGTTVYADTTGQTALAIQTEGKIMAEGTSANPIIFTSLSDAPTAGDWGGIHINGLAAVAAPNAPLVAVIGDYGGGNNADNSGTLKYIRVEYAGKSVGGSTGALNFNAVGDQTTIDYVQVFNPNARGIRFRGGKANLKHALISDPVSRAIVWESSWVGFGQFWVVAYEQEPPTAVTGIEGRDVGSNPTISNVTVLSLGGVAFNNTRAVRFRNGTHGKMYNAIITDTERGVRADSGSDTDINNGDLLFANSRVFDNTDDNYRNDGSIFDNPASPFFNTSAPVTLTGYVGSEATGALDPTTLDGWFSAATYIGAVETGNDWTNGWIK